MLFRERVRISVPVNSVEALSGMTVLPMAPRHPRQSVSVAILSATHFFSIMLLFVALTCPYTGVYIAALPGNKRRVFVGPSG